MPEPLLVPVLQAGREALVWKPGNENLPDVDTDWWAAYRARLEDAARRATD